MFRMMGLLALLPTAGLLTVSYFVLVVRTKTDQVGLKNFGMAVAVVLWIAAATVFTLGMVHVAMGPMGRMPCPGMGMMMEGKGMMMGQGMMGKPCCEEMAKFMKDHKCPMTGQMPEPKPEAPAPAKKK